MASNNIYFNREGGAYLDIGKVTSIQYANVTFSINDTVIHNSGALTKGQNFYLWRVSDNEKALIISLLSENAKIVKGKMKVDVTWEPWGWDAPLYSEEYVVSFILEETEATKPSLLCTSKESSEYSDFVQGKTKLIYKIKSEAKNGAVLRNPTAEVNGRSCSLLNADGNGNYTLQSDWLISPGINTISVTIKDSRDFSQTITDEIYVHPYAPPSLSSLASEMGRTCRRWNSTANAVDDLYGTACRIAVGVGISYIADTQTGYTISYRYRERGTANWSAYSSVENTNQADIVKTGVYEFVGYISDINFDTESEYDIELIVTDSLGETSPPRYEQLRSLSTSFNISDNGDVVAVGKYASLQKSRLFDSAWDISSDENISAKKDIKVGKHLYLNDVQVSVTAKELNNTANSTGNLQAQINNVDELVQHMFNVSIPDILGQISNIKERISDTNERFNNYYTIDEVYSKNEIDDDIVGDMGTKLVGLKFVNKTVEDRIDEVEAKIK